MPRTELLQMACRRQWCPTMVNIIGMFVGFTTLQMQLAWAGSIWSISKARYRTRAIFLVAGILRMSLMRATCVTGSECPVSYLMHLLCTRSLCLT